MTFFYNLNKKLDEIRATPSTTHGQLNERDMGKHNNATTGFDALAKKAGKEYGSKAAGERVAGAQFQKMKKAGQIEEEGMSRAAKGYEKYGKEGMEALAKAGREGKDLDKVRAKYNKYDESVEEGLGDMARKVGSAVKKVGGKVLDKLGHGDDAEMMRDLQRKMNMPQTGLKPDGEPNPKIVKEKMSPAKAKSFAALAEPKDKITFADKIAGAKKEVDEMLGDVAAEAMKNALSGGQKKLDKNNNGKLDANDFAMLRKGGKKQVADEGFPTVAGARAEMNKRKVGDVTHGAKHDTEETPTGRRVTRRTDPNTGYSVGSDTDDEGNVKSTEKRGRGRPKKTDKAPERVTAKATKHKGGRKEKVEEGEGDDMVKLAKVIASCKTQAQLDTARRMAQNFLKKHQTGDLAFYGSDMKRGNAVAKDIASKRDEIGGVKERKLSSSEKSEREDIVKGMKKNKAGFEKDYGKDAKSVMYATATKMAKERGPGNPDRKKKEKTEEAGGSGFGYGKGIYDSMNHELESMIAESMNVSMNMSNDSHGGPTKSLTVTATEDDAMKLSELLKNAGLGSSDSEGYGGAGYQSACGCGTSDCSCGEEMEEAAPPVSDNEPNWPTNTETSDDALQYSGGLNKPKSTGQTTVPVIASQEDRQESYAEAEEDAIKRMMEMAGVKEGKKPDFLDVDNDKNKKESFKQAVADKEEKKVDESILASTANLWKEYKGQHGV